MVRRSASALNIVLLSLIVCAGSIQPGLSLEGSSPLLFADASGASLSPNGDKGVRSRTWYRQPCRGPRGNNGDQGTISRHCREFKGMYGGGGGGDAVSDSSSSSSLSRGERHRHA